MCIVRFDGVVYKDAQWDGHWEFWDEGSRRYNIQLEDWGSPTQSGMQLKPVLTRSTKSLQNP